VGSRGRWQSCAAWLTRVSKGAAGGMVNTVGPSESIVFVVGDNGGMSEKGSMMVFVVLLVVAGRG
jgi:hypothetical protein